MKNKDLSNLVLLSKTISKFLDDNNYEYARRCNKTKIVDGLAFKILYGQKNMSQQKVAAKINKFKGNSSIKTKVNRSSYVDREAQLDGDFFMKLYQLTDEFINKYYYVHNSDDQRIYAVDCTQLNLTKDLVNSGFSINKNNESVNGLVLGIYDVKRNFPIALELVNHKNERKAYLDFIQNTDKYRGNLFIFDRGYIDTNFFSKLDENGINFICRLRENSKLIPVDSDDKIVNANGKEIRIVTYTINKSKYHIASNLLDNDEYTVEHFKNLYHDRWSIEEFFKYIKENMNADKINEKKYDGIRKTLYSYLFISRIVSLLILIKGKHQKSNKMIVNKSVLTEGIYNDFIMRLLYNKKISQKTIRKFMVIYAVFTSTHKGKHNPRSSKKPYTKWYIKKYYHKYILEHKTESKKKKNTGENIKMLNENLNTNIKKCSPEGF